MISRNKKKHIYVIYYGTAAQQKATLKSFCRTSQCSSKWCCTGMLSQEFLHVQLHTWDEMETVLWLFFPLVEYTMSLLNKTNHLEHAVYMQCSFCIQNNQCALWLKELLWYARQYMETGPDYLELPPSLQGQVLDLKYGTHWQMIYECLLIFLHSEQNKAQYLLSHSHNTALMD